MHNNALPCARFGAERATEAADAADAAAAGLTAAAQPEQLPPTMLLAAAWDDHLLNTPSTTLELVAALQRSRIALFWLPAIAGTALAAYCRLLVVDYYTKTQCYNRGHQCCSSQDASMTLRSR